jgi:hypothetical protein
MLSAKLPYYAKGWVSEQENFERRYNPIFLITFPSEVSEEDIKGNVNSMVGVQPTRVVALGGGQVPGAFPPGYLRVKPSAQAFGPQRKNVGGDG